MTSVCSTWDGKRCRLVDYQATSTTAWKPGSQPGPLDHGTDQPSLIHGDVWTTNVLASSERITGFLDPAIYYADPEIELAFITLFNTFGRPFFQRYHELRPISTDFWEIRRDLYNLYPLLVHVRLFGGGYVGAVEQILDKTEISSGIVRIIFSYRIAILGHLCSQFASCHSLLH